MARRKRRGHGEGSIYQRRDGFWVGAITVGYTPTGAQKRVVIYGRTRQEAAAKLAELAAQHHKGLLPSPEAITVRECCRTHSPVRGLILSCLSGHPLEGLDGVEVPNPPDVPIGSLGARAAGAYFPWGFREASPWLASLPHGSQGQGQEGQGRAQAHGQGKAVEEKGVEEARQGTPQVEGRHVGPAHPGPPPSRRP